MDLYLGRNGQQSGPFSAERVRTMLAAREIDSSDLCWHEGMAEWKPLGQVLASIAPALPAAPVAPTLPLAGRPVGAVAARTDEHPGFLLRTVAYLIDSIVTYALSYTAGFAATALGVFQSSDFLVYAPGAVAGIAAAWLYFALMESSPRQATFGKMACNFTVTDLDGRRISFGRASLRYFGMYASTATLGIGFLMCIWTERRQCLHDMIAGCEMWKG